MHEEVCAHWLLFNLFDKLQRAVEVHLKEDAKTICRPLHVFLDCMSCTSFGHRTDAGIARKAQALNEEKLLQAAAEALHERLGSSKGMVWCMDVIQKSNVQHLAPGRHTKCPELPTVRQLSNLLNFFTRKVMIVCRLSFMLPTAMHQILSETYR